MSTRERFGQVRKLPGRPVEHVFTAELIATGDVGDTLEALLVAMWAVPDVDPHSVYVRFGWDAQKGYFLFGTIDERHPPS
jgi:hypothetical protein